MPKLKLNQKTKAAITNAIIKLSGKADRSAEIINFKAALEDYPTRHHKDTVKSTELSNLFYPNTKSLTELAREKDLIIAKITPILKNTQYDSEEDKAEEAIIALLDKLTNNDLKSAAQIKLEEEKEQVFNAARAGIGSAPTLAPREASTASRETKQESTVVAPSDDASAPSSSASASSAAAAPAAAATKIPTQQNIEKALDSFNTFGLTAANKSTLSDYLMKELSDEKELNLAIQEFTNLIQSDTAEINQTTEIAIGQTSSLTSKKLTSDVGVANILEGLRQSRIKNDQAELLVKQQAAQTAAEAEVKKILADLKNPTDAIASNYPHIPGVTDTLDLSSLEQNPPLKYLTDLILDSSKTAVEAKKVEPLKQQLADKILKIPPDTVPFPNKDTQDAVEAVRKAYDAALQAHAASIAQLVQTAVKTKEAASISTFGDTETQDLNKQYIALNKLQASGKPVPLDDKVFADRVTALITDSNATINDATEIQGAHIGPEIAAALTTLQANVTKAKAYKDTDALLTPLREIKGYDPKLEVELDFKQIADESKFRTALGGFILAANSDATQAATALHALFEKNLDTGYVLPTSNVTPIEYKTASDDAYIAVSFLNDANKAAKIKYADAFIDDLKVGVDVAALKTPDIQRELLALLKDKKTDEVKDKFVAAINDDKAKPSTKATDPNIAGTTELKKALDDIWAKIQVDKLLDKKNNIYLGKGSKPEFDLSDLTASTDAKEAIQSLIKDKGVDAVRNALITAIKEPAELKDFSKITDLEGSTKQKELMDALNQAREKYAKLKLEEPVKTLLGEVKSELEGGFKPDTSKPDLSALLDSKMIAGIVTFKTQHPGVGIDKIKTSLNTLISSPDELKEAKFENIDSGLLNEIESIRKTHAAKREEQVAHVSRELKSALKGKYPNPTDTSIDSFLAEKNNLAEIRTLLGGKPPKNQDDIIFDLNLVITSSNDVKITSNLSSTLLTAANNLRQVLAGAVEQEQKENQRLIGILKKPKDLKIDALLADKNQIIDTVTALNERKQAVTEALKELQKSNAQVNTAKDSTPNTAELKSVAQALGSDDAAREQKLGEYKTTLGAIEADVTTASALIAELQKRSVATNDMDSSKTGIQINAYQADIKEHWQKISEASALLPTLRVKETRDKLEQERAALETAIKGFGARNPTLNTTNPNARRFTEAEAKLAVLAIIKAAHNPPPPLKDAKGKPYSNRLDDAFWKDAVDKLQGQYEVSPTGLNQWLQQMSFPRGLASRAAKLDAFKPTTPGAKPNEDAIIAALKEQAVKTQRTDKPSLSTEINVVNNRLANIRSDLALTSPNTTEGLAAYKKLNVKKANTLQELNDMKTKLVEKKCMSEHTANHIISGIILAHQQKQTAQDRIDGVTPKQSQTSIRLGDSIRRPLKEVKDAPEKNPAAMQNAADPYWDHLRKQLMSNPFTGEGLNNALVEKKSDGYPATRADVEYLQALILTPLHKAEIGEHGGIKLKDFGGINANLEPLYKHDPKLDIPTDPAEVKKSKQEALKTKYAADEPEKQKEIRQTINQINHLLQDYETILAAPPPKPVAGMKSYYGTTEQTLKDQNAFKPFEPGAFKDVGTGKFVIYDEKDTKQLNAWLTSASSPNAAAASVAQQGQASAFTMSATNNTKETERGPIKELAIEGYDMASLGATHKEQTIRIGYPPVPETLNPTTTNTMETIKFGKQGNVDSWEQQVFSFGGETSEHSMLKEFFKEPEYKNLLKEILNNPHNNPRDQFGNKQNGDELVKHFLKTLSYKDANGETHTLPPAFSKEQFHQFLGGETNLIGKSTAEKITHAYFGSLKDADYATADHNKSSRSSTMFYDAAEGWRDKHCTQKVKYSENKWYSVIREITLPSEAVFRDVDKLIAQALERKREGDLGVISIDHVNNPIYAIALDIRIKTKGLEKDIELASHLPRANKDQVEAMKLNPIVLQEHRTKPTEKGDYEKRVKASLEAGKEVKGKGAGSDPNQLVQKPEEEKTKTQEAISRITKGR